MKSIDPDGKVHEWDSYATWSDENGGTYTVSRPKDQDRDEPATPPSSQTRTLGWTGYQLTVKELRGWLDQIPNQANLTISLTDANDFNGLLIATWEVDS